MHTKMAAQPTQLFYLLIQNSDISSPIKPVLLLVCNPNACLIEIMV